MGLIRERLHIPGDDDDKKWRRDPDSLIVVIVVFILTITAFQQCDPNDEQLVPHKERPQ